MTLANALNTLFTAEGLNTDLDSKSVLLCNTTDASGFARASLKDVMRAIYSPSVPDADYVDLGLPSGTLWATKNLGATNVTDDGLYFSWGNTEGHAAGSGYNFSADNYNASAGAELTGNITDANDAAHVSKGGIWKMPTKEQFEELFNSANTTQEWVTNYNSVSGVNGYLITSLINNKTLFLPASGYFNGTSLYDRGAGGYYWSSSFSSSAYAFNLVFDSGDVNPADSHGRRFGFSVRAVM